MPLIFKKGKGIIVEFIAFLIVTAAIFIEAYEYLFYFRTLLVMFHKHVLFTLRYRSYITL